MNPLSTARKAFVSVVFLVRVISTLYGFLLANGLVLRIGLYSLLGTVLLFAILISPYWGNDSKLDSVVN